MISARRTNDPAAAGFSLLEIVVVLVLIAVLAGGAIGLMVSSDDERTLKGASVEIEALAKRARTVAALQQRPYALEFTDNSVGLMPLAEAMIEPEQREKAAALIEAAGEEDAGDDFTSVHAGWAAESGTRLFVRRWASEEWIPIDAKTRQVWRFDPEGFCEPVGVRLQMENSWMEVEFHPLTGSIRSTAKEVY
jgi:prepilin-type N-terminal cleavage/methylation domain-containing protein